MSKIVKLLRSEVVLSEIIHSVRNIYLSISTEYSCPGWVYNRNLDPVGMEIREPESHQSEHLLT